MVLHECTTLFGTPLARFSRINDCGRDGGLGEIPGSGSVGIALQRVRNLLGPLRSRFVGQHCSGAPGNAAAVRQAQRLLSQALKARLLVSAPRNLATAPAALSPGLLMAGWRDANHPTHAKTVFEHSETRGPEGFAERHPHLPAFGERGKETIGFRFAGDREGKSESLKVRLLGVASVRGHQRGLPNAKTGMHDFIFVTRRDHAGFWRFGAFLVTHHHLDFGTESFAVKFDGLFAVAVKEEIRLNNSGVFDRAHNGSVINRSYCNSSSLQRLNAGVQDKFC